MTAPAPQLALRPVTADDAELLFRVYASTRAEELAPVPWSDAQKQAFLRQQFAAQHAHYTAHYQGATFDVVLVDGAPAGRLYVHRGPTDVRIMDIALLPEHRGRGLGTRLLSPILAQADAAGLKVSIHVERHNPAQKLYARLGFARAGEHGVYDLMERAPQEKTAS